MSLGGGRHRIDFYDVISIENLFKAWREFCNGKRRKLDVAKFELNLENNIFTLHRELVSGIWRPEAYNVFYVQDPKLRIIHKASVRDRVLYQAVYQSLYRFFDEGFIHDSYSSRNLKGTHRAIARFEKFIRKETRNYTERAFALQCDIRKFFESIDHDILLKLIRKKITDEKLIVLIFKIINSFEATNGKGLPLGNVTSQLFANVYLNEFDQYIKKTLECEYYVRYCDDFVILHKSERYLESLILQIGNFLENDLSLSLHPRKVDIRKIHQGIDLLGYVCLPYYKVLRTRTKHRMLLKISEVATAFLQEKIEKEYFDAVVSSYKGMLGYCNGQKNLNKIDILIKKSLQKSPT